MFRSEQVTELVSRHAHVITSLMSVLHIVIFRVLYILDIFFSPPINTYWLCDFGLTMETSYGIRATLVVNWDVSRSWVKEAWLITLNMDSGSRANGQGIELLN